MPYSEKHNILFIHIPKCAGKSFEMYLGIHDSHFGSPNNRSKLNEISKYFLNISSNKRALNTLIGVVDKSFTAQHLTLQEIILGNWLEHNIIENAIKIAIIRDPFERACSLFNHWYIYEPENSNKKQENIKSHFSRFLEEIPKFRNSKKHSIVSHFRQQTDYLRNTKGSIESVNLIRLENIELDVKNFCTKYDFQNLLKSKVPAKKESHIELYDKLRTSENLNLVKKLFSDDYELLNY
jgi:hypothetical protein